MVYQGYLLSKTLVLGIIILFIGMSVAPCINGDICKVFANQSSFRPHDPIYIHGNDDFISENGVTDGSGTSNDPYIIEGWEINASSEDGITIIDTNKCFEIRKCYIHSGGSSKDGIVFYHVMNGVINCSIISNNRFGVIFRAYEYPEENSSYNKILKNTITNNKRDGIHFQHTGWDHHSYNLIFLNEISYNDQGIYLIMSAYNQIFSNNIISNSRWGVNLTMCMGGGTFNKVYHNNFIGNNNENGQACAFWTIDNDWDDGYPSGGNYWSDYYGIDNYSGPDQDIPGSDSIGDTPYNITLYWDEYEEFEYDYYPLMEPWHGNLPPFAEFTWRPLYPIPWEMVLFNASESIDYDGYIILYEWDWNDDGVFDENYTTPDVYHIFEEEGNYPVTLRVIDNNTQNDMKTKIVTVTSYNHYPTAPLIDGPFKGSAGVELCWAFLSWDEDADMVKYYIDWGDGNSDETDYHPEGIAVEVVHIYEKEGEYNIKAIAEDKTGLMSPEESLVIIIPRNRATVYSLFQLFFDRYPFLEVFLRAMNLLR